MYYPGSYLEFLIYPGNTGLYRPHWGKPLGPIPGPGEMKVSKLIKYLYQAGMEVLNTMFGMGIRNCIKPLASINLGIRVDNYN
jgi:hypothetical protein